MELDRQGIERRDFPIARRGYDPASVDAHLRAIAAEVEELRRELGSRGRDSLAITAGTQVQGILEAAQATADTIEREATEQARAARMAADADAKRTREQAVARAQQHVAAVSQSTEALLGRVGSLDGETRTLVDSLRSGAGRLAGDLAAMEGEMEALYDAAAGRSGVGPSGAAPEAAPYAPVPVPAPEAHDEPFVEAFSETAGGMQGDPYDELNGPADVEPQLEASEPAYANEDEPLFPEEQQAHAAASGDLDGARLVALNMALNGDSREETGRYIAENFEVSDTDRLLDEVYAAIEG
ncbi:MAG TPA: DivIVA domain-containing protein [Solirubrobacteraceae bacterium]|jgi:DivIVA domain-containing protein